VVASTLGVLVGLAGIEHGILELLQGNVTPSSIWIDAIDPTQKFWEYATEPTITIIPNLFVTGILAIIVGLMVTIWAVAFVHRKYGTRILFLLSDPVSSCNYIMVGWRRFCTYFLYNFCYFDCYQDK
jgi:asparagine N-glycosylation enzyme membrane subunit Stt3